MASLTSWLGRIVGAVRTPWIATVAVLAAAQVVSELAFSFALPFTPLYVQELGVKDVTEAGLWAGLMAGTFAVASGAMGPVWGTVADRFGHRLMIQRASFGAGIVLAAMAFVQTPEQLLVLRTLQGALSGVIVAMATLISVTAPRQYLATALGLMQGAVFLGISLGPILGGTFADRLGLRATFAVAGALLVTTGVLVTLFVREPSRDRRRTGTAVSVGGRAWLKRPDLLVAVSLMAIVRFASVAPQPVLPLFVQQLVDRPEGLATTVGLVLAATGVASTISALLAGRVAGRYGQRATLLGCLALAAVLSPLHALVGSVWQLVVLRTATGLALGAMVPSIQSLLVDATPAGRRGAAFGLLSTANAVGNGGGPVVGSVVAAGFGVPAVFVAMAPVFAAAGWVLARAGPTAAREPGKDR